MAYNARIAFDFNGERLEYAFESKGIGFGISLSLITGTSRFSEVEVDGTSNWQVAG